MGVIESMLGPALLMLFAATSLAVAVYWTQRDHSLLRWATRLALTGLLLALLLPADAIHTLANWFWALFSVADEKPPGQVGAGLGHVLMFTAVGFLFGRLRPVIGWLRLGAFLAALVVLTEVLQHLSPGRHPSLMDVGLNTAGVLLGLTLLAAVRRLGWPPPTPASALEHRDT